MDWLTENLETIVRREVLKFHGSAYKAKTFFIEDAAQKMYVVLVVVDDHYPIRDTPTAQIVVMARIENERVIIDEDISDRPLYEALERAGVPRDKIIARYAGEPLPAALAHP
ncbi:MAG: element excision factor XisI family protein [Chloroflexota bacterium]|nr:element excision factor XisI family protein [Chloroflexota bacterium]